MVRGGGGKEVKMAWRDSFQIKVPGGHDTHNVDLGLLQEGNDEELLKLERASVAMRRATPAGATSKDPFAATAFQAEQEEEAPGILRGRKSTAKMGKNLLRQSMELVGDQADLREDNQTDGAQSRRESQGGDFRMVIQGRRESSTPTEEPDPAKRKSLVQRVMGLGGGKRKESNSGSRSGRELADQELPYEAYGHSADNPMFGTSRET